MRAERISSALIAALCLSIFLVPAQLAEAGPYDAPPPQTPSTSNFIKADTLPWLKECEWTDDQGKFQSTWTKGLDRPPETIAPAKASCNGVKRILFADKINLAFTTSMKGDSSPVATGHVMNFMYVVQGHGRAMVDGKTMETGPGDAFAQMPGRPHQTVELSDDYQQFDIIGLPSPAPGEGFKANDADLARGDLISHKDAPKREICEYGIANDVYKAAAPGSGDIPKDAACFVVYSLLSRPGGSLIEVYVKKGTKLLPHREKLGSIIYYVKGKVRATVDGESKIMEAGDAVLHPGGGLHADEWLEDTIQLEIRYPGLDKTPPDKLP